jgi:hypothetical protein
MAPPIRVNSQAKGKRAELAVANYLTRNGLPARRFVRTGTAQLADEGDIRLDTAPATVEVKDHKHPFSANEVKALLAKLGTQKRPGDLGLLVVKRQTYGDPGDWYCYTSAVDAGRLIGGVPEGVLGALYLRDPVCFSFADTVRAIVAGDFVESLVNPFA